MAKASKAGAPTPLRISLLTSCTVTRNFTPVVRIADAPVFAHMNELCAWWVKQMREAPTALRKTPGELYAGASFGVVTEIAQVIGHNNIYIVTGGVGLSRHTDKIVPYDFTSDRKAEHNAHQHVQGEKFIPHLWWPKINEALHDTPTPVADLLKSKNTDIIVGALPKAFIKYILADLQHIPHEDLMSRVFILIPRSSMGSIPKDVHAAFVPYGSSTTQSIHYTRNDKAQRVAQKFIAQCTSMEGALETAMQMKLAVNGEGSSSHVEVDYDEMFATHPALLEADSIDKALQTARILGLKIGGKHRFAGAWRGARGTLVVDVSKKDLARASEALKAVLKTAKPVTFVDDEDLLHKLAVFVTTVREQAPQTIFTSRDISKWGAIMYPEDAGLKEVNKITYLLGYHAKYLGLEKLSTGAVVGYRLA